MKRLLFSFGGLNGAVGAVVVVAAVSTLVSALDAAVFAAVAAIPLRERIRSERTCQEAKSLLDQATLMRA